MAEKLIDPMDYTGSGVTNPDGIPVQLPVNNAVALSSDSGDVDPFAPPPGPGQTTA